MRCAILVAGVLPAVAADPSLAPKDTNIAASRAASQGFRAKAMARRKSSGGGVAGVVGLIESLLDDTKADKKESARIFAKFNKETCDIRRTQLETSMEHLEGAIAEFDANAAKATARAEEQNQLKNKALTLKTEQEGMLEMENKVYAETKKTFDNKIKEADETIEAVRAAIRVLKDHTGISLLQRKDIRAELTPLLGAYSAVINALAKPDTAKKYASFMHNDDDMSLAQAPQASTSAFEPSSGGIIDLLEQMLDDFEDVQQANQQELTKATRDHDMQVQNMDMTIKSAKDRAADAEADQEEANTDEASNEKRSKESSGSLAVKKQEYEEGKVTCQSKTSEEEAAQARMAGEINGLIQCLQIFSDHFGAGRAKVLAGSFLQVAQSGETRTELVRELRELGRKLNSFGLMQLAAAAKSDPFGKIKGLIEKMITRLQEEQAAEEGAKQKCDADLKRQTAAQKKARALVKKLSSRKGAKENSIFELKNTIEGDEQDLKELRESMQAHEELYNEDKEFLEAQIEMLTADQNAMEEAIQVFKDEAPTGDVKDNIVALLERTHGEFVSQEEDASSELNKCNGQWQKWSAEATSAASGSEATISANKATVTREEATLESISSDLSLAETDEGAASKLLSATKNACTAKVMSHEEKQKRRGSEIAGLKKALEVLNNVADDAEFVQKSMKQTFLGYN